MAAKCKFFEPFENPWKEDSIRYVVHYTKTPEFPKTDEELIMVSEHDLNRLAKKVTILEKIPVNGKAEAKAIMQSKFNVGGFLEEKNLQQYESLLASFVACTADQPNIKAVYSVGSLARREKIFCDMDVLFVISGCPENCAVKKMAKWPLHPICYSEEKFKQMQKDNAYLLQGAVKVYERQTS